MTNTISISGQHVPEAFDIAILLHSLGITGDVDPRATIERTGPVRGARIHIYTGVVDTLRAFEACRIRYDLTCAWLSTSDGYEGCILDYVMTYPEESTPEMVTRILTPSVAESAEAAEADEWRELDIRLKAEILLSRSGVGLIASEIAVSIEEPVGDVLYALAQLETGKRVRSRRYSFGTERLWEYVP